MEGHPGGDEVLLSTTGKFSRPISYSVLPMIPLEIDSKTVPAKHTYIPPQQAAYNPDKTPEFVIKILQFLVPLLILGLATAVRHYTKKE
ncbi:Cytochrome b5 [Hibiscus syriacus]|uniref:Cytochrome b5 n=1 Tax=Hibiscus syriacus TaxID=106335 RepID=A0A6A2WN93_HIBSY|nr:Cytochrome b5 [Hibiscus syriacus]